LDFVNDHQPAQRLERQQGLLEAALAPRVLQVKKLARLPG
jgi:hypothetical protein